jgi:replication fork clamp-binding protein CrfC
METEVISTSHILRVKKRSQGAYIHGYAELLIHSYFNIVKREMIDMVPKAISLTLVSHSKENLQRELLQELYKPEVLDDLLKESEHIVSRRKEVISMVQALNKAEE